ncbi:MAG: hypothetical protein ACYTER_05950 [Planctomycetota bacterium]|jgi:hypothetical protein
MDREALGQFGRTAFQVRQGFIWFLRFISIFLLLLVIFLTIWRKLPWKVTAVLALVPVLGILVPRKLVIWVWLLPLVGVLGIYIWIQLPGQSGSEWSPYRYDIESEVLSADWSIPDANNAAFAYEAVLNEYGESVFGYQFISEAAKDATFNGAWRTEEFPKFANWLTIFNNGIAQLQEAARMEQCRFEIVYDMESGNVQKKRNNQLKGWVRLLIRSSNLDLGEGRFDAGLKKQLAAVRIAQHLYDQQSLFEQTGAFDIELLASRALETTIVNHCNTSDTLAVIEATFLKLDSGWAKSWQAIIEREKLVAKNIAGLFYEVNADGRTRISHQAMYAMQEGLGFRPRRMFLKQHEMNRLAVIGFRLSLPFTPEGMAAVVDKRFDHYSLQTQKGDTPKYIAPQHMWQNGWNCRAPVDWLAVQQVKWFWALDGNDKRHDALENLIQIFVALKKYRLEHGQWPEGLSDLGINKTVLDDPVHGKPFAYQRIGDDFMLYGLGPNGVDDGGVNDKAAKKDDILFWPRGVLDEAIRKQVPVEIK